MSDWSEACDPVPARRELSEAQKLRLRKISEKRRLRRAADAAPPYRVDADFDEMGA
jgi:hypothetical protein